MKLVKILMVMYLHINLFKEEIKMTETLYKIDIPQQVDYKKYLKMLTDKDHPLYFETLSLRSLESWVNSNIKEDNKQCEMQALWKAIHIITQQFVKEGATNV